MDFAYWDLFGIWCLEFGACSSFRIRLDLFHEFLRFEFLPQVLPEKTGKDGLAFFQGLGGKGYSTHLVQRQGLGEKESLDRSQGDRDGPRKVGGAGRAEDPPSPGTEEIFFSSQLLLTADAVIQLRTVAQAGEKAHLEDPLDFILENPPVDEGEKGGQESEKGLVLNLLGGHFVYQLDEIAGPGEFVDILPEPGEGPDQITVAEADKPRAFLLEIGHLHVGPDFQPVPETLSGTLGPFGDPFDFSEIKGVESDDLIRLTVGDGVEDDGRGFVEGHKKSYQKEKGMGRRGKGTMINGQ